jgi:hypothetical protein
LLEILTRPYGSAGTAAQNPHPLVAEKLEPKDVAEGAADEKVLRPDRGLICAEQPG